MAAAVQPTRIVYRFSDFEFREDVRELRKFGLRVKLERKPLMVLAALLETRGEIVTREALQSRLWGERTFVDFDLGLNVAMRKLRDALAILPITQDSLRQS